MTNLKRNFYVYLTVCKKVRLIGVQTSGPCHASLPFTKQLVEDYSINDFEIISIETWSSDIDYIKSYVDKNKLNYKYLISTEEIKNSYQVTAVPAFFILDKNRIIRKVILGYGEGTTDKEIINAIEELI